MARSHLEPLGASEKGAARADAVAAWQRLGWPADEGHAPALRLWSEYFGVSPERSTGLSWDLVRLMG